MLVLLRVNYTSIVFISLNFKDKKSIDIFFLFFLYIINILSLDYVYYSIDVTS